MAGLVLGLACPAAASDLRLTGVLVSGTASLAIISGSDLRDKVVRIGQEINPGATLGEVSPNGVVVLRHQRREWLPLVGGTAAPPLAAALQASEVMESRPAKAKLAKQMGGSEAAR